VLQIDWTEEGAKGRTYVDIVPRGEIAFSRSRGKICFSVVKGEDLLFSGQGGIGFREQGGRLLPRTRGRLLFHGPGGILTYLLVFI
jgi:hypothetical protein